MTPEVASTARKSMAALYRASEPDVLKPLLERAAQSPDSRERSVGHALGLLADLRAAQGKGWVNQFLQEYRLNSSEGVALLSLAEAFLRVPDPETADLLIADKLGDADWRAHTGKSSSTLVNSATWGLVVGRALVGEGEKQSSLRRLIARAGEPFVRQAVGAAMKMMGEIFVMGRTIDEAMKRMRRPEHKGFTASFDMLGEAARTEADAARYFSSYKQAILQIGKHAAEGHSVSVKLSALHPRYEVARWDDCVPELAARLEMMVQSGQGGRHPPDGRCGGIRAAGNEPRHHRARRAQALQFRGWNGFGLAVQAYSKRARAVIAWADAVAGENAQRWNVRLVKGAYWDSEIKRTQVEGLADYPLFTRKAATDVSYLAVARDMLDAPNIRPAFASHNALTVATIMEWAGNARDFEFQRLHGMGDGLYERLVREHGYHCRVYAPVGGHRDLLAYLVRRLLENGANSSFVHQLADERLTEAEILADPVAKIAAVGGARHPSIPLPVDLFGAGRRNSAGLDLSDRAVLECTVAAVGSPLPFRGGVGVGPTESDRLGETSPTPNPSPEGEGLVYDAITRAHAAFPGWSATPVEQRAACPRPARRFAGGAPRRPDGDLRIGSVQDHPRRAWRSARGRRFLPVLRASRTRWAATGRTPRADRRAQRAALCGARRVGDDCAVELPAGDFPRHTVAALVAGNTVVAKPAPQTPRIAVLAVELAHEAGIPADALVLVPGGPEVGAALTADPRIAGVAFTGSTATARKIARALLDDETRPIVPLIAETGGINAMIVDSTALPEQVVADVVTSAFRSAGQRCSALRLLLLQEDIADATIEMLKGAMDTLRLGDPADPATDVGPVIDQAAYDKLMTYRASANILKTLDAPADGLFVPPTLIRLDSIKDLDREWFGPVLHVATWPAGALAETIRRVNAKGYGLTMGLHSRIARSAEETEALAAVGNLYVNRSMIGAVVGSQPFGGEGLSGTGPKAGGPHYLHRFVVERAVSTDTTSAGGNATLLSLDEGGI